MIGDSIRTARLAAGLTQKELAARMGVNYQMLQKWEYGTFRPNAENLVKLAGALGMSVEELIK